VIDDQLDELPGLNPGFVSVLVGVNDVVRGVDIDTYGTNLRTIFHALLDVVPANRVLLVTMPDYTLTPNGADYGDPARQSARIRTFNAVLEKEAAQQQLLVVDITGVADRVPDDPSLVADDGLHPSGKQYAAWADQMAPSVRMLLRPGHGP
jgi:lysophospholipase L1-like esterase